MAKAFIFVICAGIVLGQTPVEKLTGPTYTGDRAKINRNLSAIGANTKPLCNGTSVTTNCTVTADSAGAVSVGATDSTAVGVIRSVGGTAGGTGVINFSFTNPADSDMWLKIRSGSTADQRAYIAWYDYANVGHKWLIGRNASNDYVTYDAAASTHRMRFVSGGISNLDSSGSSAVRINNYGDATSGTGGLEVWSGGATPALWTRINGDGVEIGGTGQLYVNSSSAANIMQKAAAGSNAIITYRDGTVDKWFAGKHAANNYKIYNYNTSAYALDIDTTNNAATFGATVSATGFYIGGTPGLTKAVSVRKGDDSAPCTLTFTGGILTAQDCTP